LALGLAARDRAVLARELIESLESSADDGGVEEAWIDELEERAAALECGEAKADDWQASLERVRQQLRQG